MREFLIQEGFPVGGGNPLVLIAGPCVLESEEHALDMAREIAGIARRLEMPYIFKSSYDKANRTSLQSFRGPGLEEGLEILGNIRSELGIPVITDAHTPEEAEKTGEVVDIVQVPAFLCRQTDLLQAAGRTGKVVNIKKGQFMAPEDMIHAAEKVLATGNQRILLTERGTSFGYHNLVVDMRSLVIMREAGYPVIFDATHSVQMPGGAGGKSSGDWRFAPHLARAAAAVGMDGLFLEAHHDPARAPSDGPNMIPLQNLEKVLQEVLAVEMARRGG